MKKSEKLEVLIGLLTELVEGKGSDEKTGTIPVIVGTDRVDPVSAEPRYTLAEVRDMFIEKSEGVEAILQSHVRSVVESVNVGDFVDTDDCELSLDANTITVERVGIDEYNLLRELDAETSSNFDSVDFFHDLFSLIEN